MHTDLKGVSDNILTLGIGVLSQAQRNVFYTDHGYEVKLDESVFAVLQAAHAAELIIKAAIAKEHPLLIFASMPKSKSAEGELLSLNDLFENGKTVQYSELPEKLWAVTGHKIANLETFNSFGRLRNCIQHFSIPDVDLHAETVRFIYEVIDPVLEHFWDEYAVRFVDACEYEYHIFESLASSGLSVRVPPELKEYAEPAYDNQ